MSDRTHYPPGDCVGCGQPAASMPLCVECRAVWEHDGDCWIEKDSKSQLVRDLAAVWIRGYQGGYVRV